MKTTTVLTTYNRETVFYDTLGNPVFFRGGMYMKWAGRKMVLLKNTAYSSEDSTYSYGADGLRVKKTAGGVTTEYEYGDGVLLGEKRSDGIILRYTYDALGMLSSIRYTRADGTVVTYYVRCNAAGDVEQIFSKAGILMGRYIYDSWGNLISIKDRNGNEVTSKTHIARVNPIRYRGYYYDEESGYYYVESRYYDPVVGRWVNADVQLNTSLGILGLNLFSYCINNPVNMADYGGNKPGDLFDTMDEAARDFAEYINAKSIEENREYASYIYSKTTTVKTFSHYVTHRFLGWTWKTAVYTKSKKTQYSYREPKRGTINSSSPPINWFWRDNKVARLHTHAAYDPKYDNDNFSDYYDASGKRRGDKINAINAGMPSYVATPLGTLRKFDPSDGSDIVLFSDIPFDPNHPLRR